VETNIIPDHCKGYAWVKADQQVEARRVLVPTWTRNSRRPVRRCTSLPWQVTVRMSYSWSLWAASSRSWQRWCWACHSSHRVLAGRTSHAQISPSLHTRTSRWNWRPCENYLQNNSSHPYVVDVAGGPKAAFTPGQHVARQHVVSNMCPVAVNMLLVYRQQNCWQFVAHLLLDTKGYKSTLT